MRKNCIKCLTVGKAEFTKGVKWLKGVDRLKYTS